MVSRPIVAGFMTILVFVSGFSVGMLWDTFRTNKINNSLNEISVYSTSLFLESQLIGNLTCSAFLPVLKGALVDLDKSLQDYVSYSDASIFGIDDGNTLYRKYLLSNIRYWKFAENYQKQCDWNVSIMLLFFDDKCGAACDSMGTRLDYLKKKYNENLLVFPLNFGLANDDPVALTLKRIYNVTSFPSVVVGGKKYGEIPLEKLEGLVCQDINC